MSNKFKKEEFVYCMDDTYMRDYGVNTKVFRVDHIEENNFNGGVNIMFLYPMVDNVFITTNHTDENGDVTLNLNVDYFKLATDSQIVRYIRQVYDRLNHSLSFTLYDTNKQLIDLYLDMKKEFIKIPMLYNLMEEKIEDFEYADVYNGYDRELLNLLRSYYKCRIKK